MTLFPQDTSGIAETYEIPAVPLKAKGSKYELLFENINRNRDVGDGMVAMSVQSFLCSLPFMMARISPVGCFFSLIPLVVLWVTGSYMGKMADSYAVMQWKTARRLLNIHT